MNIVVSDSNELARKEMDLFISKLQLIRHEITKHDRVDLELKVTN